MFWKKKTKETQNLETTASKPLPAEKSPDEVLMDTAVTIARELRNFERAALEKEAPTPDRELLDAQEKLDAARKIVRDGRLSYALIRQLAHHVAHWSSWIKRDDFRKYVKFDADDISAERTETDGEYRKEKVDRVSFVFEGNSYSCVIRDKGYSAAPGDTYKFGEVELWVENDLVLKLSMTEDYSKEYSSWEYRDVMAFRAGAWMTALIKIARVRTH